MEGDYELNVPALAVHRFGLKNVPRKFWNPLTAPLDGLGVQEEPRESINHIIAVFWKVLDVATSIVHTPDLRYRPGIMDALWMETCRRKGDVPRCRFYKRFPIQEIITIPFSFDDHKVEHLCVGRADLLELNYEHRS